jgi:hypothetical protein
VTSSHLSVDKSGVDKTLARTRVYHRHIILGNRLHAWVDDCEATMKKFVQDLWNNPFFWISFAVVIVIRLLLK